VGVGFLEEETRSLVKQRGEEWIRQNRRRLLAELAYIWSL
jgi:hypothetical protein